MLMRLSHDRLLKLEPYRDAFVATSPKAKQNYEAWRLTEAAILRDVVQVITPAQIDILKALMAKERLACKQKVPRLTRLSAQFHIQLAEYCHNQFLSRFLKVLVPLTSLAFF